MKNLVLVLPVLFMVIAWGGSGSKSQSKYAWVNDSNEIESVVEGENYLFIVKKKKRPVQNSMSPITPENAIAQLKLYEEITRPMKGKRTFSVTLESDAVLDYLAYHGGKANLSGIRIYAGAYPATSKVNPGRITAFLVGVDKSGNEVYSSSGTGGIQNLANLCPPRCPDTDNNSIYSRAGKFKE
jgi:hypothetical protein